MRVPEVECFGAAGKPTRAITRLRINISMALPWIRSQVSLSIASTFISYSSRDPIHIIFSVENLDPITYFIRYLSIMLQSLPLAKYLILK